jgi:hypothetical protein
MIKMEIVLSLHGFLNRKRKGKRMINKIKIFISYDITFWNDGQYKGMYKSLQDKKSAEQVFENLVKSYDNVILEEVQEKRTAYRYVISES